MSDRIYQILIVDDSPADVRLFKEVIRDWKVKHCINVAEDVEEAMDVLCQRGNYHGAPRPDVIVLDINLPRTNGLELLRWIRSESSIACIPVIVLTSSNAPSDVLSAYNLKVNCFIKKPTALADFVEVMRHIEIFWFGIVTLPPPAVPPICETNMK
jgi:two-component system, chemotaxis family, response regulator Rcp1